MSSEENPTPIGDWTLATPTEPYVRIGVILDEDARVVVRLHVPAVPYELAGPTVHPTAPVAGGRLEVRLAGGKLKVSVDGGPEFDSPSLRLSGPQQQPLAPGLGVGVADVVAGRGFHWQKNIDQTLSGAIELVPGEHGVVLVNELPLEDYLAGVITAEMGGACPADLLKAQCIVARSWLLAMSEPKHTGAPFDRCNDDCCQRYQGTEDLSPAALAAVRAMRGHALLSPTGDVLDANYAKSCGGISETPQTVWGVDKPGIVATVDAPTHAPEHRFFPVTEGNLAAYLDGDWLANAHAYCSPNVVPVEAIREYLGRVDETDDYFRWTVRYERRELETLLRENLPELSDLAELRDLRVVSRGTSGRADLAEVEWQNDRGDVVCTPLDSEYRIREVLHRKFLYSSAFAVHTNRASDGRLDNLTLRGAGWGHGVGLCQIGALGMALSGIDFEQICIHYYPAARLAHIYE